MPNDVRLAVDLLGRVAYGRVATSLRALPFLAPARHIVADDRVLLRMHRGFRHHEACVGSVVAYGADNLGSAGPDEILWTAQIVGRCETVEPTAAELARFGPVPGHVDGEPYDPVHLCVEADFGTVESLGNGLTGRVEHVL